MRIASPAARLICLTLSLLLTACGGGGGGSSSSADNSPEPSTPPETVPPTDTFSLSGTITTSDSQTVDRDTNDPTIAAVSNDTPDNPQPITNPITLGGYINQPGSGPPGRSQQTGDTDDFFQVDLLAGQRITMVVGDFSQADADLLLWDTQGNIPVFSADTGEVESLVVPEDGTYLINVVAFQGATNYILAIGTTNTPAQVQSQGYKIVPWQAVVTYRDDDTANNAGAAEQELTRTWGLEQRAGSRGRGRLMALRKTLVSAQQRHRRMGIAARKLDAISDPDLRARWETLMTVKSLHKDPRVRSAKPNYQVFAQASPNDAGFPLQWHYPLIGLPEAWETTTGDPGVVVAVIDTGILPNHPDLAGQLVDGYDFVQDDGGIDPDPRDPGSSFGGGSEGFHGTHVSGTVAARGNNGLGVAGTAYGARVMPLRALGAGGGGTTYDIDQAVRFAAGLPNDSGTVPSKRADIINLSLGGAPFDQDTKDLYKEVRAAGVVIVAAAGNEASSTPLYPASYDGVISVSAVDAQRRLTNYSNTGARIDVSAPGGNNSVDLNGDGFPDGIFSTNGVLTDNRLSYVYTPLTGTSMATPHVAGVLALMKSVNPDLTPADIDNLLVAGALSDDLGLPGRDDLYGHGLINAQRAVLAALEATGASPADNPRLVASASTLNFGSTSSSLTLILQNGGKGDLELLELSVSQPWLRVVTANVDGSGLGEYEVIVDRTNLAPGIYSANITAQSSVNNLAVQVLVSLGRTEADTDLGVIYILLYDPVLNRTITQFATAENGGTYPYQFTGIAPGEYELVAGTDADNDLFICDAGEACGAWLTIDQPIRIQLEEDITGLDFPVEYLVSLPTTSSTEATGVAARKRQEEKPD
jgi:serine protease